LRLSSAYHPQTDGQTERIIQSLEDLLRACVSEQGVSWVECLPLIEKREGVVSINKNYVKTPRMQMAKIQ